LVSIGHAPAEAQAIHPDGEVAVAKGAARAGTAIGQSSLASSDFKDVAAANPKAFFQLYWSGSRDVIQARVERMRSYGAKGLIITLDATMTQPRDWGSPVIPQTLLRRILGHRLASQLRRKPSNCMSEWRLSLASVRRFFARDGCCSSASRSRSRSRLLWREGEQLRW
jgi:isopentenyl diphosphate isomerase/L-lactate dehydrogenase-like FMN-dependent dehydrogenase